MERISRRRKQPLIFHANTGNAMRAATLEVRLEDLGVFTSFSRPRVSNDNPYSQSLFRTVKYCPDYPSWQLILTYCSLILFFGYDRKHRA